MTAAVLEPVTIEVDPLYKLFGALGAQDHIEQVVHEAWRWFRAEAGADALAVAALGPPDPAAYIVTAMALDADSRAQLIQDTAAAAGRIRPDAYPRRASDVRVWATSDLLHTLEAPPVLMGQWAVQVGGAPVALVRLSSFTPCSCPPGLSALLASAARIVGLHACAFGTRTAEPEVPDDPSTFEELLEAEVFRARRVRLPVSLALVEIQTRDPGDLSAVPSQDELDEIQHAMRCILRQRDRVHQIRENCLAVVMPRTDARGALVAADRLQRGLRDHFADRSARLLFHVGIGGRDPEESQASELFARAAQALSQARLAQSENAFVYI